MTLHLSRVDVKPELNRGLEGHVQEKGRHTCDSREFGMTGGATEG